MSKRRPAPLIPEPIGELFDAHTHIDSTGARDQAAVEMLVDRARQAGVSQMVTVADDIPGAWFAVQAAHWNNSVWAAVALHPTRAKDLNDAARRVLEQLGADDRTVAIGETGLDYYWLSKSEQCADQVTQQEAFRWHIDLAKRLGKPLMIHNRDADEDVLQILQEEGAPEQVIMHCFSSGPETARQCIDAGYFLSFAGNVSFKKDSPLQQAAQLVPFDQFLLETDAPYLTPAPYRGAPNEPYCLPYTALALAEIKHESPELIAFHATGNARRVYSLCDE